MQELDPARGNFSLVLKWQLMKLVTCRLAFFPISPKSGPLLFNKGHFWCGIPTFPHKHMVSPKWAWPQANSFLFLFPHTSPFFWFSGLDKGHQHFLRHQVLNLVIMSNSFHSVPKSCIVHVKFTSSLTAITLNSGPLIFHSCYFRSHLLAPFLSSTFRNLVQPFTPSL